MIDHDYQIDTREVTKTSSCDTFFVATLSQVYIIIDGKRRAVPYPQTEFEGKTQLSALLSASDTLRHWLKNNEIAS